MFPLQEHMPHGRQLAVIDPGTDLFQQGRRFVEVRCITAGRQIGEHRIDHRRGFVFIMASILSFP